MKDSENLRYRRIVEERRAETGSVRLELGCGASKTRPDAVGIDLIAAPGVDLVADVIDVLSSLDTASVDEIFSAHFLEHVADPRAILEESARVLKPGSYFRAVIPHFSNPLYHSDPTHRQPFGLYTFNYYVDQSFTRRQVPHYDEPVPFFYENARYVFKSVRPHYLRHAFKQVGRVANLSRWTKELYEEVWTWWFPAYEVEYALLRLPDPSSAP